MRFIFLVSLLTFNQSAFAFLSPSGVNATSIQGTPVSPTPPSGTQCLVSTAGTWGPGSCAGSGGSPGGSSGQIQFNDSSNFGGTAGFTYLSSGHLVTATAQAVGDVPLTAKGAGSQTADLQQWQKSDGTVLDKFDAAGDLTIRNDLVGGLTYISGTIIGGYSGIWFTKGSGSATGSNFGIAGNATTTIYNAPSTLYFRANNLTSFITDYNAGVPRSVFGYNPGPSTGDVSASVSVMTPNNALKGLVVLGNTSQAANLQEWQDSSGNPLSAIGPNGEITFGKYHLEPGENNAGNSSTAQTIDWSVKSSQKSTLTGNVTYTFSNLQSGGAYVLHVAGGSGGFTMTWPGSVTWLNATNTAPASPPSSGTAIINFYYDGTTAWGSFATTY